MVIACVCLSAAALCLGLVGADLGASDTCHVQIRWACATADIRHSQDHSGEAAAGWGSGWQGCLWAGAVAVQSEHALSPTC